VGYGYADAWMIDSRRSGSPRTITWFLRGGAPQKPFFDACPTFRAAPSDIAVTPRQPIAQITRFGAAPPCHQSRTRAVTMSGAHIAECVVDAYLT